MEEAQRDNRVDLQAVLHEELLHRLEHYREMGDEEILERIDDLILSYSHDHYIRLNERWTVRLQLFNAVRRLDILQELIDDNRVTEIMVNGTESIFIEREGAITAWDKHFTSKEKLEDIVQQIAAGCNRRANEAVAIVDARLRGGERVNIVMSPVALNGPVITIRRFPDQPITMSQLISWNSVTAEAASWLEVMVKAGYNIFISGGTGSGKTTFLNALSNYIPKDERIITIEDNAELQIQGVENLVRLEARRPNEEGENGISIRDLIRSSLRMRPDRIVVGEVRGEETIDMLQAMNTGHDGSLSTGHGNSPQDMLTRLETMILLGTEIPLQAVRRQIASGLDLLIHLGRLRDKSRRVLEICEIDAFNAESGEIDLHPLFRFEEQGVDEQGRVRGCLKRCGTLNNRMKLKRAGLCEPIMQEADYELG